MTGTASTSGQIWCLRRTHAARIRPTRDTQSLVIEEKRHLSSRTVGVDPLRVDLTIARPAGIGACDVEDGGFTLFASGIFIANVVAGGEDSVAVFVREGEVSNHSGKLESGRSALTWLNSQSGCRPRSQCLVRRLCDDRLSCQRKAGLACTDRAYRGSLCR
jgi:hypothetical protein